MERLLKRIERIGNKLPDINILFFFALFAALLFSFILSFINFDYTLTNTRGEAEKIVIKNMFLLPNFLTFISKMVENFISFPPLAITLAISLGIGIAEYAGLLRVFLIKIAYITPKRFVTPIILLISVFAHIIADSAYVFLMPISAALFVSAGRHPVAGISAAFAGLAGGFSASFTPSAIDPIMQGLTQKAAHLIDPNIQVNVLCNYFVSIAGILGVVLLCWLVCDRIVEPFLKKNLPIDMKYDNDFSPQSITPKEQRAFRYSMGILIFMLLILFLLCYPENSLLRGSSGSLTSGDSLLMKGLVPFLFLLFAIPGYVFGKISGRYAQAKKLSKAMGESLHALTGFIAFSFICAQFLYVFNTSNLSKLLAISGAEFLKDLAMPAPATIFGIIIITGFLNLFVTSATSKWSVLAPVFVPMLMLLGISPELTQAAFRISDSAINVMTPLFPFYPLIIFYAQKYCSKMGVGTLSSIMIPYSIALMIALTTTLYLFWFFGIPLGFESSYTYAPPGVKP